jgi:hypothetical protein
VCIDHLDVALHHRHHKHSVAATPDDVNEDICCDKKSRLTNKDYSKKKKVGVLISGTGNSCLVL